MKKHLLTTTLLLGNYKQQYMGKVLVTWRMLPGDDENGKKFVR